MIETDGENFLKFDTFSCIFKAIFRFLFPRQVGGGFPPIPPSSGPDSFISTIPLQMGERKITL